MSSLFPVATVLAVGLGTGIRHAMESDHLAAVATLVVRRASWIEAARLGAFWGLGHTLTLALVGGSMLALGQVVPERAADGLELLVGVMLVLLGLDCLRRLRAGLLHEHVHRHGDGQVHVHRHFHLSQKQKSLAHRHFHLDREWLRAIVVGMVHGLAGSAALVLLAVGVSSTPLVGLGYVAVFGAGSIVGMALLALAIGLGLKLTAGWAAWPYRLLAAGMASFSCLLGAWTVWRIGFVQGLLLGA